LQRFFYVLAGEVLLDLGNSEQCLDTAGYCYLPPGCAATVKAREAAQIEVIEKIYREVPGTEPPGPFVGSEEQISSQPFMGDERVQVKTLLPSGFGFDLAVNTMCFQPGAALPMVEIHMMEHGLTMLAGGGIYRLDEEWYPVTAGDFIWMAPYCPQWFGAIGKGPARYLIYKDWNRGPWSGAAV
jgi:(S)-ureidoglycine aminohydrolase